jgi:hypothetical protein
MKLNFNQIASLLEVMNQLQGEKVPFKLGLIIGKNTSLLKKEEEFYIEREREFAQTYLEVDDNGMFVTQGEGVYKIKDGLEEECRAAGEALNDFECDVDLRLIPVSLIENMEFTPAQLGALECIIEED